MLAADHGLPAHCAARDVDLVAADVWERPMAAVAELGDEDDAARARGAFRVAGVGHGVAALSLDGAGLGAVWERCPAGDGREHPCGPAGADELVKGDLEALAAAAVVAPALALVDPAVEPAPAGLAADVESLWVDAGDGVDRAALDAALVPPAVEPDLALAGAGKRLDRLEHRAVLWVLGVGLQRLPVQCADVWEGELDLRRLGYRVGVDGAAECGSLARPAAAAGVDRSGAGRAGARVAGAVAGVLAAAERAAAGELAGRDGVGAGGAGLWGKGSFPAMAGGDEVRGERAGRAGPHVADAGAGVVPAGQGGAAHVLAGEGRVRARDALRVGGEDGVLALADGRALSAVAGLLKRDVAGRAGSGVADLGTLVSPAGEERGARVAAGAPGVDV